MYIYIVMTFIEAIFTNLLKKCNSNLLVKNDTYLYFSKYYVVKLYNTLQIKDKKR